MNILLLGGTGVMGNPLAKILAEDNYVYVTSRKNRKTNLKQIEYLCGNAHDADWVKEIVSRHKIEVIVDFMVYSFGELEERLECYLDNCKQYVFLSSSRVYAPNDGEIDESSPRLLDICKDADYLKTNEYALSKAREEDLITSFKKKNWTIIRPYITYGSHRLQLGVYEKEQWLYRCIQGRTIVCSEEMINNYTTLTLGYDVSRMIAKVVGNRNCFGQIYQLTCNKPVKWGQVLKVYIDTIGTVTGKKPKIKLVKTTSELGASVLNPYQWNYDRKFNRKFNSDKIERDVWGGDYEWTDPLNGLRECLIEFLQEGNSSFQYISWKSEAVLDRLTRERTPLSVFENWKDKCKYLIGRYTPFLI